MKFKQDMRLSNLKLVKKVKMAAFSIIFLASFKTENDQLTTYIYINYSKYALDEGWWCLDLNFYQEWPMIIKINQF
jgi:hypothetical protein